MTLSFGRYLRAVAFVTLLGLAVLAALHLLGIPRGDLLDWGVGLVSVWWLLLVTTVPWNVRFDAQAAIRDAEESQSLGIAVDASRLSDVRRLSRLSLAVALVLHVSSAAALYAVAAAGWSAVGYPASAVAVALTFVRPGARAYAYLAERLYTFRKEVHHPREDVVELRQRLVSLESMLDLTEESWASTLVDRLRDVTVKHNRLSERVGVLSTTNADEHSRLEKEYRSALATVTEDRQFVEHLREIVRFVRRA
ncbi:hypothetical protein [Rubricoccus marinus]|uniref:Uncharacterized protein n=1 Tax=Rubricoccus marinus TaxID=716817 RepID=A0A259U2W3_9BACT|nr:hypothetical protein [Rubricoccus marinus]OZC04375.1 hypothetical protein BSZ36_16140 [Rubricoccus marinus]